MTPTSENAMRDICMEDDTNMVLIPLHIQDMDTRHTDFFRAAIIHTDHLHTAIMITDVPPTASLRNSSLRPPRILRSAAVAVGVRNPDNPYLMNHDPREHGKLYIEEDFSDEDLSDEEDTADFIDRTENTANFPAEALDTEKSLPEESVSDRVLYSKENQAAHESEDLGAEENLPEESVSDFEETQPTNGSENSCNEDVAGEEPASDRHESRRRLSLQRSRICRLRDQTSQSTRGEI
ncbi:hypothetical protein E4U47_003643 [Claviceps purpurea]|nr:hypothetical protein E4U47_003643 [Claviceps purpurea]